MGIHLYVIFCFSLAFNTFSLHLILISLINMCLGMFLIGFLRVGFSALPVLGWLFFPHVRQVLYCSSFKYFFNLFLFSGTPII